MGKRTRIELDRFELGTLIGIMVLFSGLMFTFGLMVGYGAGSAHAPEPAGDSLAVIKTDAKDAGGAGRSPASEGARPVEAGAELKRAFVEAKQQALRESLLQENRESVPKSVADAAAHFEANAEWNRRPSAVDTSRDESERLAKAAQKETERLEKGPGESVRGLFERKPDSIERFQPNPGQYTVRLGSYATEEEAVAKVASLRKLGFNDAYFSEVKVGMSDRWYRVSVGSFVEEGWAKKTAERLFRSKATRDYRIEKIP